MTTNFSNTGVYFEIAHPLSIGEKVSLVLPFDHAVPGTRASCLARVLRIDEVSGRFGVAATYETISFDVP